MTEEHINKIIENNFKAEKAFFNINVSRNLSTNSYIQILYKDYFYQSISKYSLLYIGNLTEDIVIAKLAKLLKNKRKKASKYIELKDRAIEIAIRKVSTSFGIEKNKINREDIEFTSSYTINIKGITFQFEATFSRRSFDLYLQPHERVIKDILLLQEAYEMTPKQMLLNLNHEKVT